LSGRLAHDENPSEAEIGADADARAGAGAEVEAEPNSDHPPREIAAALGSSASMLPLIGAPACNSGLGEKGAGSATNSKSTCLHGRHRCAWVT
jgi:hypothetical protein